jgi:hypothetical protein
MFKLLCLFVLFVIVIINKSVIITMYVFVILRGVPFLFLLFTILYYHFQVFQFVICDNYNY